MSADIREALNAAGAAALIQKRIDPLLLEYQRRYSPLVRTIPTKPWDSTTYYFNKRTSYVQGGFVTDGGARPVSNSVYEQDQFTIKNLQEIGSVTGYAQQVTADLIGSLRATEIEGAAKGLSWDIETGITWGCAGATLFGPYPEFDGLDVLASQYAASGSQKQNAISAGGASFDLGWLDQVIDLVETNVAEPVDGNPSSWMFVMSPTANSKIAQLLTNQQRFMAPPVGKITTEAGLNVATYRDIPIIKSSFLSSKLNTMSAVTAASVTSGGTLAAATYYYKVSAVIGRSGESIASLECSVTTSGPTSVNTLSFTPPVGYENSLPIHYKVFRSTSAGAESLVGFVDANVAVQADGVTPIATNQIVDTGATLIAQNSTGPTQPGTYPAAYVNGNSNVVPLASGEESIYLMSRDPNYIVRPYVRDMQIVDLYPNTTSPDSLPFGLVSDCALGIRALGYLGRISAINVALSN